MVNLFQPSYQDLGRFGRSRPASTPDNTARPRASARRRRTMSEQTVNQTSYYPQVECETRKGDADWEVVVAVKDEKGDSQFLSVSTGMVAKENGKTYLAIG